MILSDKTIRNLCIGDFTHRQVEEIENMMHIVVNEILPYKNQPMITPFVDKSVKEVDGKKIVSYGLSSYGYDVRLAPEFKIFNKPNDGRVIDVHDFNEDEICDVVNADEIVIPPGGLVLGRTVEYFSIPRNVVVTCLGKSTWARVGAIVHPTPLEPEWCGHLVIEITNGTNLPLKIYANEGIAQLQFHLGDQECEVSYGDRGGKYQGQTGITTSKL